MKHYRTATIRAPSAPSPYLDLTSTCEYCNRARSAGKHAACSKLRQAKYQQEKKR